MRVLVTGGHGALASALRALAPWPRAFYAGRASCDVRNAKQVADVVHTYRPDVIVHAAAITDHQTPDIAGVIETNIIGTTNVAHAAQRAAAHFIYLSTHYVYSGTLGWYSEESEPYPIGTYAWSKLAGEIACQAIVDPVRLLIVRGSWYTNAKLASWARDGALSDAWCSREPVAAAAAKIAKLVSAEGAYGVYNIGGERRTFCDICRAEMPYVTPRVTTRAALQERGNIPYTFPVDTSVSTAKYARLFASDPNVS